mmetsp:Transcript_10396/g.23516  ORF Transcript_10396/g.23516 Transcript_10396/m.23516 type:complete len:549 (-) Transcript_10396:370-2016(-)
MMRLLFACLLALAAAASGGPSATDLRRARVKKPRDTYRGDDQTRLSQVLNSHILRSTQNARPCAEWTTKSLQDFLELMLSHRSDQFQHIYNASNDRRKLSKGSIQEYRNHWQKLNRITATHGHLLDALREAHCREAVMWWVHHLTDEKRGELQASGVAVPLLPEGEKLQCGEGQSEDEVHACLHINEPNSCDWCHSTQARHDAEEPGMSPPDALDPKFHGPDDGNPHGWDRKRRCDQDQMPRCQMCEGIGGHAFSDKNEDIDLTPCTPLQSPDEIDPATVAPPLYPKKFTVKRKDGKQGGYSDTLIGWKTDPFCFAFFPQNDSVPELCYRSEDALVKYYDIEKESARSDYTIKVNGAFGILGNITSSVLHVNDTMWVQNRLWLGIDQCVCTNPSGNHCTNPPCKAYIWHWDTFKNAQHLGRERIGVEWIQDHGVGNSSKMMELDHFILWAHHIWTDPVSRRIVRAWKPFNGLQLYDPEAWLDDIQDQSVFDSPPAMCKKGGAQIRIHCDDEGRYDPKASDGLHLLETFMKEALQKTVAQSNATRSILV